MFYDFLEKQKYTVLFIDGNHEDFQKLYNYPVEIWNGGRVHKIRKNVIHLMRGEIYRLMGTPFLLWVVVIPLINIAEQKEFHGGRRKCH